MFYALKTKRNIQLRQEIRGGPQVPASEENYWYLGVEHQPGQSHSILLLNALVYKLKTESNIQPRQEITCASQVLCTKDNFFGV